MRTFLRLAAMLSAMLAVAHLPLSAKTAMTWKVEGKLIGKPKTSGVDKKPKDISGIACTTESGFPRRCLVIDDEAQIAQEVTLYDGSLEAGALVPLIENTYDGKPLELDGEGIAYAGRTFYVIGSHGRPRHPKDDAGLVRARVAAASQIVPVHIAPDGRLSARSPIGTLSTAIASEPELATATGRDLDDNGVTIEGVAVRGDRLFAGFRGPSLPSGRTPVLSVSLNGLQGQGPIDPHLFKLPLGAGRGVREMTRYKDRFLVLAGPTGDTGGRYAIFLWDGKTDDGIRELINLSQDAGIDPERKAEALLFLDETNEAMRVLLLFDGEKEGAPTPVSIPLR